LEDNLSLCATILDWRRKLAKSEAQAISTLGTKEATILNLQGKVRTVHAVSVVANAIDVDDGVPDSETNVSYWKAQALGMKEALQTVFALSDSAVASNDSGCSSVGAAVGAEDGNRLDG
jgi:hypothetical protein